MLRVLEKISRSRLRVRLRAPGAGDDAALPWGAVMCHLYVRGELRARAELLRIDGDQGLRAGKYHKGHRPVDLLQLAGDGAEHAGKQPPHRQRAAAVQW